ncbi:hypothetical protein ESZ91_03170 [Candidatus Borkfalkia ceftriaxoniphila]|uniref:Uncharacterized protein n=1 Tax=Candidatus Borkfalkia ceftriaxoniphila TaxID=2508949 RepID=A0A4Q2KA30_9FIRM|nr:hypothetical protein [Candidatus Borkfalkia ceftriaxoniphila]RXZ61405.1 hypothetical protein ESZ91_03170 [Candidatus Borkfalkia ceftriaxoniphila]
MGKKKSLKTYIPGAIALVLGIAAFCMMFLDAVKYSADAIVTTVSYKYSGAQLAFGYKETVLNQDITILSFNFMVFLAFVLPLAGGILGLLSGKSFILKIIATACFVVGAVFLFSTAGFATIGMSDSQAEVVKHADAALCAGPIVGGVISVLGAVVCFFKKSIAKMFG